ncbi:hypothetical protein ACFVXC_05625 [Streptomyces sp. NPDC058257]|uniref:hypothetical protein n=1 Tax=Streptomyces sp. NPDC058257 TaxID=3346409 RepID=UPI0036E4E572
MSVPTLFVPPVLDGDQGLVLRINGVAPEPCGRRWYVLTMDGVAYGLPQALWPWAMELDAQTRRRERRMPAAFAFRRVGRTLFAEPVIACL